MNRTRLFYAHIGLTLLFGVLACTSKSPFSRSPAEVAVDEPCRFMGTLHKESRQRIEEMRACEAISLAEWKCMAHALKALDREFTQSCRTRSVRYERIAERQRALYLACPVEPETAECGLLSEGRECLRNVCQ